MKNDRSDEIINNILQLRIDIAKLDIKIGQSFRMIGNLKDKRLLPQKVVKQHEEPTDEEIKELFDLGFCGGDVIRCPNCNEYIVIKDLKYCMDCGQALDWSDMP